jgi:DNA repair protein RecO (recombination protein O)
MDACYNPPMPSHERSVRVEAVVLSHTDWGEADRILWLYTRELGKVRAIAKGVRKPRSRKAGHLEPFTRVSLQMARGRDMWIVTQAESVNIYTSLREDLLRVSYAAYVVELLDRFTYEEGENLSLYSLLCDTLGRLDKEPEAPLAVRYYEVRLLDLVGFRPMLFSCAVCGNEIKAEDQYFSAAQGGVVCPVCATKTPGLIPISMQALRYLRHFQRSTFQEAQRAHPSGSIDREMEQVMQHYLTYLLERSLNSPAFLRRVRREENLEK